MWRLSTTFTASRGVAMLHLHRERSLGRHAVVRGRNGKQTKVEANDVQPREVRCGHSCETCEQGWQRPAEQMEPEQPR